MQFQTWQSSALNANIKSSGALWWTTVRPRKVAEEWRDISQWRQLGCQRESTVLGSSASSFPYKHNLIFRDSFVKLEQWYPSHIVAVRIKLKFVHENLTTQMNFGYLLLELDQGIWNTDLVTAARVDWSRDSLEARTLVWLCKKPAFSKC